MAQVMIQENVWQALVKAARRRKQKPEVLTESVLRDFLRRQADEELLVRSIRAARRSRFPIHETETVIRQYRGRKEKA